MSDKIYINKDKTIDYIYDSVNKDRELTISKSLIKEVIESQNEFTLDKIEEGTYETITWKWMGKFEVNFNKLKKLLKHKKK